MALRLEWEEGIGEPILVQVVSALQIEVSADLRLPSEPIPTGDSVATLREASVARRVVEKVRSGCPGPKFDHRPCGARPIQHQVREREPSSNRRFAPHPLSAFFEPI